MQQFIQNRKFSIWFLIIVTFFFASANAQSVKNNKIEIKKVTASSWENKAAGGWADFLPEYAIDGDLSAKSSFRTEGLGEWIMLDLGEKHKLSELKILFFKGNDRKYTFSVETAKDSSGNWKIIKDHFQSNGNTADFESVELKGKARYVKITGFGNTNEKFPEWINIVEVEIY